MNELTCRFVFLLLVLPLVVLGEECPGGTTKDFVVEPSASPSAGEPPGGMSIAEVWCKRSQMRGNGGRSLIAVLAQRHHRDMTQDLDDSVCGSFGVAPSRTNALFLGLCNSERSHRLLVESEDHPDPMLRDSVRLALARRGNRTYTREFIANYQSNAISRELTVQNAKDRTAVEAIRRLEYIGSPDAVMALFDSAASHALDGSKSEQRWVVVHSNALRNLRDYLNAAGVTVADEVLTERDLAVWWNTNRESVAKVLREKVGTLPRLKGTRLVVSYL